MSHCPVLISTASAKSFGKQCPNKCEENLNEHGLTLCKKHQSYTQALLDANIHDVTAAKLSKDIRTSNDDRNVAILAQHTNELPLYNKMHEEAQKHSWYFNKGNAYNENKETIQKCINDANVKVVVFNQSISLQHQEEQVSHDGNANSTNTFITLKNNKRIIVDADKLSELNQFTWHENNNTSTTYIETEIKKKKLKMSRYLMNPEPNEDVIYLNNDTFDNRMFTMENIMWLVHLIPLRRLIKRELTRWRL